MDAKNTPQGVIIAREFTMRITSISAVHHSSDGVILLDVLLDSAGVPNGVDLAWLSKHFLGAPVPGANMATVNLAHVVAAVEFVASMTVSGANDDEAPTADEVVADMQRMASEVQSPGGRGVGSLEETTDLAPTKAADRSLKKKKNRKK